jgi:type IV pilus assembly protein PilZ
MTVGEPASEQAQAQDPARELSNDGAVRADPRAPIVLKVEYKRLNTFFYDYTKNISKGGTFIKTDRSLGVGTVFLFRLIVPQTARVYAIQMSAPVPPIELRGEVRWVVKPAEASAATEASDQEAGMGIRFVYAEPGERTRLERAVEKMMVESLGPLICSRLLGSDSPDLGADGVRESREPTAERTGDRTAGGQVVPAPERDRR